MSLRLKANLLFAAGALLLLLPLLLLQRVAAHRNAVEAATEQAALLTAHAEIAGRYTAEKVAPVLSDGGHGQLVFVPAAAPFYAAQANDAMMQQAEPGVVLRQVVLNPVGAADRPADAERDLINRMRADPHPVPVVTEQVGPHGRSLTLASPLLFFPGACATCYVSRAAAPAGVLDAFGDAAGFDNKPGEVVGVTLATVPMPVQRTAFGASLLVLLLALLAVFNLVLELLVLRPLGRVAAVAERVSLGQTGVEEFDTAGNDEIGGIARSFNRLRRSMESAIALIEP